MTLRLHSTLSGTLEDFTPLTKGEVSMYHCGPTVYDSAHIGNLRTFVMNDLIRRSFEYHGYKVNQVMNITDVDDKTIRRSTEEGTTLTELTRRYEDKFLSDIETLGILRPHHILRATENIGEMIAMISTLIDKGIAYTTDDGVYFSINKIPSYGSLAHLDKVKTEDMRERIARDEYDKDNPQDFALWKFCEPDAHGEAAWAAPFGRGRPGWHIECSAMAIKALGPTIDIHTGGVDLIFPHHTNEIAQSEAATGEQFVRYWIHGGFMNVDDVKMSKSKGNFLKLDHLIEEKIAPLSFRYWLLGAHYRTQVNFTLDAVSAAQTAYIRLIKHVADWHQATIDAAATSAEGLKGTINADYRTRFADFVAHDFDMPKALALVWELIKDSSLSTADKLATILDFDRVLGLNLATVASLESTKPSVIPPEIIALAEARQNARLAKDWPLADALRSEINNRGYDIKDIATDPGYEILDEYFPPAPKAHSHSHTSCC